MVVTALVPQPYLHSEPARITDHHRTEKTPVKVSLKAVAGAAECEKTSARDSLSPLDNVSKGPVSRFYSCFVLAS